MTSTVMAEGPSNDMRAFRDILAKAKNVVVLSGAGISAESGVPTFRCMLRRGGAWERSWCYVHVPVYAPERVQYIKHVYYSGHMPAYYTIVLNVYIYIRTHASGSTGGDNIGPPGKFQPRVII